MSDLRLNELIKQFQAQEGGAKKSDFDIIREVASGRGRGASTEQKLEKKLQKEGKLSKRESHRLRFIKEIADPEAARAGKVAAKASRVAAFEEAVANGIVSASSVQEWGGSAAAWDADKNQVARDANGEVMGFGRRYISKQAANRAFNKLNNSDKYKTHGTRAAAVRRDICTKATSKNRRATTGYKQNPRAFNYRGIDDGSQCEAKYGVKAHNSNKRLTEWTRFVKENHGKGKTLASLAAEYRAQQ